ncbi:MAG TPA: OB-fold domain-containing protein [Acidimicrobiales bacterium]
MTPLAPPPSPPGPAVADGLWSDSDPPRLLAGCCRDCGAYSFPVPDACARCSSVDIAAENLPPTGTLWTWTVQRFQPKEPFDGAEPFAPYGVGYVDFGGKVLVEGRLVESDPRRLAIGMRVETCLVMYRPGTYTYAFREVQP